MMRKVKMMRLPDLPVSVSSSTKVVKGLKEKGGWGVDGVCYVVTKKKGWLTPLIPRARYKEERVVDGDGIVVLQRLLEPVGRK
ncbi:hypothetical protein E3N88_23157 [Mikania micrantha]|uniref:Uncharacterized protein n=1 Tax=Mikania micrantha TaxID=192012 RepID=A0A5N6NCG6_9ASTR|nr:hypothetical protein E3N88_23157 [Mikania micrantha]